MTAQLTFIGAIRTPYTSIEHCPNNIQTAGPNCQVVIHDPFKQGLNGLVAGDNILILYWWDGAQRDDVMPIENDKTAKGVFALRSPHRPNPIGAAVVPISAIENGVLMVQGLDCVDNTPLIDIKPAIYRETTQH